MLNAFGKRFPHDGLCRAVAVARVRGPNYRLSAYLYNKEARRNPNIGHIGLLFNGPNDKNFDFVTIRYLC